MQSKTYQFNTIALIGRPNTPGIEEIFYNTAHCIQKIGLNVVFEISSVSHFEQPHNFPILNLDEIGKQADVALVIGGDGTMLGAARHLAQYQIPLIGVNLGRLGFITDIAVSQIQEAVPRILQGQYEFEERSILEAKVIRNNRAIFNSLALNDVVVTRHGVSGMVELKVLVNDHFMSNQRSDGLIVATPTGSTAYALSSSGPILHPCLKGIVLVPIAPHALSNRPIVLSDNVTVSIEIISGQSAKVNFDMQSFSSLRIGDIIEIKRSKYTTHFLHPLQHSYFATLRQKLHWNKQPELNAPFSSAPFNSD